jgi:hypothetical protein
MKTTDSSRPVRVQLSRKKGWRMPPGTVKVDRTTPFGNPFPIDAGREKSVQAFREWFVSTDEGRMLARRARAELRGKNLACWCPLDGPCHADTLLAAAND